MTTSTPATSPADYRYRTTLYDRIRVGGELKLTHYHVYEPISPQSHQGNVFIPVEHAADPGDWANAQDCYGNRLSTPAPALTFVKDIQYDRFTHDYTARLDGEYIGSYPTQLDAETALDSLVYDLLASGITATAHELDGGSDAGEIAADYASLTHCPTCDSDYAGPVCARCWQPDGPRLTFSQLIALAVNGPDAEPAPEPQGPEEDTNYGGWRASKNAAGWGVESLVSWGS